MARDGDVPTIFHPKRVRAPSVIITSEEAMDVERGDGDMERPEVVTPLSPRAPLTPQTSVSSAPPLTPGLQHTRSDSATSSQEDERQARDKRCRKTCCSNFAKKIYCGICVTIILTASWVAATHCIKHMYLQQYSAGGATEPTALVFVNNTSKIRTHNHYNAPFFTAWFITNWLIVVYPLYLTVAIAHSKCKASRSIIYDAFSEFREKGFTFGRFVSRCGLFSLLWVVTGYMYTYALKILLATDVVALFATNVSCVYLLSWVILHEQFVGVRIVAAILCDTGIALLAYMDGITGSPTLGGVVLAACAAAGFAIFKVLFRKVMGEVNPGQRALFFSIVGVVNAALLWPVCLGLYLTGSEAIPSHHVPWTHLLPASVALLVFHVVYQFGSVVTYNIFVSLGLITAVPVSAALDVVLYNAEFEGMKLAGIVLIAVGFALVMLPDNWPDYIMRLLRWSRRRQGQDGAGRERDATDFRTGYIRSHLRSPSGRVR